MYAGETGGDPIATVSRADDRPTATALVHLTQGKPFTLRIEYARQPGNASISLAWQTPNGPQWKTIDDAVQKAGTVIVVGGIDHTWTPRGAIDRTCISQPIRKP